MSAPPDASQLHPHACRACALLRWRGAVPYCAGGARFLIEADAQVPPGVPLCATYAPASVRRDRQVYDSHDWWDGDC